MFPASPDVDDARGRRKCQGRCGCREEERCRVLQWRKAAGQVERLEGLVQGDYVAGQVERLERVVQGDYVESINVNWERAEDRQLLRHCAKITRSQSSTFGSIRWERAEDRQLLRHCAKITRSQSSTLSTIIWERAEDRQLLRHCAKITRSQSSTSSTICWERAESQSFFSLGAPVSMEPGNLQRLCGTPGARSGQATSIQGFLPELGRFQVRGRGRVLDGVRWRK